MRVKDILECHVQTVIREGRGHRAGSCNRNNNHTRIRSGVTGGGGLHLLFICLCCAKSGGVSGWISGHDHLEEGNGSKVLI